MTTRRSGWGILAGVGAALLSAAGGIAGQGTAGDGSTRVYTLDEAVRTALDRNRELEAARYGLESAGGQVSEAWGNVWPSLDFSAGYTRNIQPQVSFLPAEFFDPEAQPGEQVPVQFGADNSWQTSFNAEQIVFDPRVFLGVGAASRFETLQREVVRGRAQAVATRTRIAYYDILLAREEARLTRESLERVRRSLAETRAMFEAGVSSELDVLRLEVEQANLSSDLRRSRNAVAEARRNLAVELAADDLNGVGVVGSLAEMDLDSLGANRPENREILTFGASGPFSGMERTRTLGLALEERTDVRQAELTTELRKTEMRVEQVEYLPRISIFGAYSVQAQENGSPDFFGVNSRQRATSKLAGIQVTLPVFTGFQREALIDQKRATLRQARAETRLARDRAEAQVTNLLERVAEARDRARAQKLAVRQAQRGYEIAGAEYREGVGSQLQLTDAEVALRQSEVNYARAVYDYLTAQARLDEATGQVPLVDELVRY